MISTYMAGTNCQEQGEPDNKHIITPTTVVNEMLILFCYAKDMSFFVIFIVHDSYS